MQCREVDTVEIKNSRFQAARMHYSLIGTAGISLKVVLRIQLIKVPRVFYNPVPLVHRAVTSVLQ
jgi:hypothetical protein